MFAVIYQRETIFRQIQQLSMKKILITGGTGNLGKQVVDLLLPHKEFEVSILSSRANAHSPGNLKIFKGDLAHNIGLANATENAEIIIHCASDARNFKQVDIDGTHNLLSSLNKKIRHFIYISIVGVDKTNYPYYQAKHQVEKMIAGSGIPYTILRTTQFHSFVLAMLQPFVENKANGVVKIPKGMKFQSVDIKEVAQKLVELSLEEASGLLPEFGGPEILSFEKMSRIYLDIMKLKSIIEPADFEGVRYELFRTGVNLCRDNLFGKVTWQVYLKDKFTR
jgi:uncharacterized protein YbjT (DUF2867 family)